MTDARPAPSSAGNFPETKQNQSAPQATTRRTIQIADYQPHPRNYNRHPADQLKRIGHSLATFGQVRAIVVWRGYFLAGHGVAEAAKMIGWSTLEADALPDDYPEAKALAYLAADNELSRLSDPDDAQLAAILQESRENDPALMAAIGYTDQELRDLLARIGAITADIDADPQTTEADRLAAEWSTAAGQLWQAGSHRILCGDSTDPAAWRRLMAGQQADLLWTDPPYGVDYAAKNAAINHQMFGNSAAVVETDIADDADITQAAAVTQAALTQAAAHSHPGAAFYMTYAATYTAQMITAATAAGWGTRQILIWVKQQITPGRQDYHYQHEPILYGWKPGAGHTWIDVIPGHSVFDDEPAIRRMDKPALIELIDQLRNDRRSDVIRIPRPQSSPLHPTSKPPALIAVTARNNTRPGDLIIDPFAGSGSTLIAAQQMDRRCYAIELSPGYVAVILQRYQDATGDTPQLLEAA